MGWRSVLTGFGLISSALLAQTAAPPTGLLSDVSFQAYTPLSSSAQLMRRLLSPVNAQRLQQRVADSGAALREQPIDLAREHFALYVPAQMPANGYALLVFVPPWNEARVPGNWQAELDAHGVILVTAANAGNDADVLDRREPLALLAAFNVMARYRVDAQRVYVGGFSGGARVAQRVALGYPDLFHGALLDAGSDAIGEQLPPPPRDLLYRFQQDTRLVYLTGDEDAARLEADRQSRLSLKAWCVSRVAVLTLHRTSHALADASALGQALGALEHQPPADPQALEACRSALAARVDAQLDQVQSLIRAGTLAPARDQLVRIDARYGGLAAPRSVALAQALSTPP
jgi:dienelactone hydrolase